ncbi:ankyrin [Colletotrichum zoysiae]|uniref:Ankyrin n=1 Tax=Colletotrichum zoysiae TaxID=1216348 RepID=A0AAD9HA73_9PEZI|nr:ankyrin [Colletotrichum zoysiae]
MATRSGYLDVVELLLTDGNTSASSKDHLGRTLLYDASNKGHHAVVNYLLSRDPSAVNLTDRYGSTCLSAAARKGHFEIAKSLLDAGAEMFPDSFDRTPLWWARRHGHTAISQLLLEHAKTSGITASSEIFPEVIKMEAHAPYRICDVCDLRIPADGVCHRCSACNGGEFDICGDCFTSGARCLQPSHEPMYMNSSGHSNDNVHYGCNEDDRDQEDLGDHENNMDGGDGQDCDMEGWF